jgi:UDP-3-O-[3-hydroxymyristoyl] glucosamine N-acyltransferase
MISKKDILGLIQPSAIMGKQEFDVSALIQLNVENTNPQAMMWVSQKNIHKLEEINFGVIICNEISETNCNTSCTYLICSNPRLAFQKILNQFFAPVREVGISASAYIHPTSQIGHNVFIGHNVVIEQNCLIGDNCTIGHNTVIKSETKIGDHVIIGSNNTIGGVGFGYERNESGDFDLIHHIGNVIIKNNVEIGNNTCIDRAVMGSTILEENVKVDNLVHIAHGVKVGKNSLIIANAMVAGSVDIGENVWVAPSSSILNGLKIENNAFLGLGAVVIKNVETNTTIIGNPGKPLIKKNNIAI